MKIKLDPIIEQTINQKQISFWKTIITILVGLLSINIIMNLLTKINPVLGAIGALIGFVTVTTACFLIIYKRLAYYNYKIIEDELIMERVFSRANHLFLSLKICELEFFLPYEDFQKKDHKSPLTKLYKFVSGKNRKAWYVGEFTRSGDRYRFIIEPNEDIIKAISFNLNK